MDMDGDGCDDIMAITDITLRERALSQAEVRTVYREGLLPVETQGLSHGYLDLVDHTLDTPTQRSRNE